MNKNIKNLVGKYIFLKQNGIVNPNYIKVESISYSKTFNEYEINNNGEHINASEIYAMTSSKKDAKSFRTMFTETNSILEELKKNYEKQTKRMKSEMNYSLSLYGALVPENHFY